MSDDGRQADATPTPDPTERDEVLARYLEERNKRLRDDGNEQYLEVTGRLSHYVEDPYVPPVVRDPRGRTSCSSISATG